uniref:RNA-editing substrate-binding complex 6 protein domain-containing protein n=1 Tax=Neospora caninum (strain Liverpool) TaxID=572307 RepID=A0A0F7UD23_NEOCL|nr:TPA: hypothetical protein BN1204_035620 [Neospora caninum Liverpool]
MILLPTVLGLRCRGGQALLNHRAARTVLEERGQRLHAQLFSSQVPRSPFDRPAVVPQIHVHHLLSPFRCFAKKRMRLSEYDEYENSTHPSRVPLTFVNVPIHHQSASELVDTVVVAGQLRLKNPNFWRRCTTAVTDLVCGFRVRELVAILNAYAKARYRDEHLFSCLAKAIARQASQCRPSDIAVAAQAFARMNIKECAFMDVVGGEASRRLHEMGPRGIAMLAWSYGRLGISHEALLAGIFHEILENVDAFASLDLTQVIWAFGELNIRDVAVLSRICDKLRSHLSQQTLSESLICTHALSKILFFDHEVLSELRSLYVQRLRELPLAELPLLLHTFVRLDRQCAPHERPPPSTRLHRLLVKAILNNVSFYRPTDIERARASLAAAELADDFLDDVASFVLPSQIRAMTVDDKVALLEFYRFSAAPNWSAIADIVAELFPSPPPRLGDWCQVHTSEEQALRCLEALAAIQYREGVLYVLQALKEADDANRPPINTRPVSSCAPDADHRASAHASLPKRFMTGAVSLVVQRLLCQLIPTEAEFITILEESCADRASALPVDETGPAVSRRLEDSRGDSPAEPWSPRSSSSGVREEAQEAGAPFAAHLGSFAQLTQAGDAARRLPNATSCFHYMGRTVQRANAAVADEALWAAAQHTGGACNNEATAPQQSFWNLPATKEAKQLAAGDDRQDSSVLPRDALLAEGAEKAAPAMCPVLSSSTDAETLPEQEPDASSALHSSHANAANPRRDSPSGDSGRDARKPSTPRTERLPVAGRLRLNPNVMNVEVYNALNHALAGAEPHDLVAALVRFPQDPARGLWIRELVTTKIEALDPEYLPGVLLELATHLKRDEDFETKRKEVEADRDQARNRHPLPSPEEAEAYMFRVFDRLFCSSAATSDTAKEGDTSSPETRRQTDYPCLDALSNSALAVCVKMLEVYSDREAAQRHAVACASLLLRRLSAASNDRMQTLNETHEGRERAAEDTRTPGTLEPATAKQLARIFHSLVALDVLPSRRLCIELARRIGLLSSPDLFTVLRTFAALGCCEEPVATHLALGLSLRKSQIKSWRKMRELEFLCSRLGVDLEDGLPTSEGGSGKERGARTASIADALGEEDDESLGAVELPKDSELPKLEDELDQDIVNRVEKQNRGNAAASRPRKASAARP